MTSFNIGSQHAAAISNVGGDMAVHGGIASSGQFVELQGELSTLADELARLDLSAEDREDADRQLAAAKAEAARPEPDKGGIAHRLERLTVVLHDAGALAGGGLAVLQSLQRLGGFLGPAGHALLGLAAAL